MYIYALTTNSYFIIAWALIFAITLIIEITTSQMVSIWFSIASFISFILSLFKVRWEIQVLVFLICSVLFLIIFKLVFKNKLKGKSDKTNIDAIIGEDIYIDEDVNPNKFGAAKIRGIVWTITSKDDIKAGQLATILEIKGNKLEVKKKDN